MTQNRRGPRGIQPDDPRYTELLKALRLGHYVQDACAHAGISEHTVYSWIREADAIQEALDAGEQPTREQQRYLTLAQGIKEARIAAASRNLQVIQQAATGGTWQAAAWYLERSAPDKWGRFQRVQAELTGADGGPIQVETSARQAVLDLLGLDDDGEPGA